MENKYKFIRGARIIQQLNEDSTLKQLERNTLQFTPPSRRRQYATDPIRITSMELIPAIESRQLIVKAVATSDSGKTYDPAIVFNDVEYHEEPSGTTVTFVGTDGEQHHITPINLNQSNVKVRCTCLDFYYRFATWNAADNSLYGDPPPPYKKKTDRPPVNPKHVPGVCKHLLKLTDALRQARLVRG